MRSPLFLAVVAVSSLAQAPTMTAQSTPIVIHADRILDGRGNVIQGGSVVVNGDKISKVDKSAAGAATYDLKGYTLLPGSDRRALAPDVVLQSPGAVSHGQRRRHATSVDAVDRGECLRHAHGRLHDDSEPRVARRQGSARLDRRRADSRAARHHVAQPAQPDAPHARFTSRARAHVAKPKAPTSSRSSRRRAFATAARRR